MTLYINKPIPKFSPMAIDIETSGLDPFQNHLLSVTVSDGTDVWVLLDFFGFDNIKEILADEDIVKIAHNAKFEHVWFKHHISVDTVNWYDTFLAEKVIATDDSLPMSLDEVIARHLGVLMDKDTRKSFENHPGFASIPVTNEQLLYMANDVLYLINIKSNQMTYVRDMGLQKTLDLEHAVIPAVSQLELEGVTLDVDLWHTQKAEFEHLAAINDSLMRDIVGTGYILEVPAKKNKQPILKQIPTTDINLNSPAQLKEIFNKRFGRNTNTTNAAYLEATAKKKSEVAAFASLLLKYKGYRKRSGFDYTKFFHPITGKVHPSYHQLGARTGRFSCSKPNLQQVPRPIKGEPNMRRIWTADSEDYVIIRADYSQQEPRIMAQLCGDAAMIEACNKEDVYIEFGKHIFGHPIEKGSEERHTSKTFVLAVGYGAGADRLAEASGKDKETCLKIRNKIRSTFPAMAKFGDKMYRQLVQYGYVETAIGRRRYIPNQLFTIAVNTPVQGTAADMFKLALVKIHTSLTNLKKDGRIDNNTRVWNLVHDEIEVHCHKDEVDFVLPLVKQLMEEAGNEICPGVLHVAEAEYGYRWDK